MILSYSLHHWKVTVTVKAEVKMKMKRLGNIDKQSYHDTEWHLDLLHPLPSSS